MSIDNGGPAFPTGTQLSQNNATGETTVFQYLTDGMTLRDYFAAKAMEGLNTPTMLTIVAAGRTEEFDEIIAVRSYQIADAMLKTRNK